MYPQQAGTWVHDSQQFHTSGSCININKLHYIRKTQQDAVSLITSTLYKTADGTVMPLIDLREICTLSNTIALDHVGIQFLKLDIICEWACAGKTIIPCG